VSVEVSGSAGFFSAGFDVLVAGGCSGVAWPRFALRVAGTSSSPSFFWPGFAVVEAFSWEAGAAWSDEGVVWGVGGVLSWVRLRVTNHNEKKTTNANFRITASS
jgi:hypothetical protein